jgi:hypothetical protein
MTDRHAIRSHSEIQPFSPRRNAEARGLRRALALAILAATVFAGSALIGAAKPAAMQLGGADAKGARVLAYAEPLPERFGAFDSMFAGEDEHELNDAWMGMTAVSSDGAILGYVTDAFIGEDGEIDELVITPAQGDGPLKTPVYLPAQLAELGDAAVRIAIDARAVAQLEPAKDLALLGE